MTLTNELYTLSSAKLNYQDLPTDVAVDLEWEEIKLKLRRKAIKGHTRWEIGLRQWMRPFIQNMADVNKINCCYSFNGLMFDWGTPFVENKSPYLLK